MLVNFVWDEGQNILIFVGGAHATVASGGLFKLAETFAKFPKIP